jgi:hypothetical protein
MSEIEIYWQAIRKKSPKPLPEFKNLPRQYQDMVINSVNLLLLVIDGVSNDMARQNSN